jgi:hypothetical protein
VKIDEVIFVVVDISDGRRLRLVDEIRVELVTFVSLYFHETDGPRQSRALPFVTEQVYDMCDQLNYVLQLRI